MSELWWLVQGKWEESSVIEDRLSRKKQYNKEWREKNKDYLLEYNRKYHQDNKEYYKEYRLKNREKFMVRDAKRRAKLQGVPFDIVEEDITIPEYCPILGIKLENCGNQGSAPSLDKLIPSLGYVKGNVSVISYRANMLKNNMTLEEITRMAEWANNVK